MRAEGIGAGVLRREDHKFLVGRGQYVADLLLPGTLHCSFVRSPHAHARIGAINVRRALEMTGVVAVYTGAEMAADRVATMAPLWRIPGLGGSAMVEPDRWALARDTVRHVGEPVAIVIASSAQLALDAAEAVEVDWEPLPAVTEVAAAAASGAPQLYAEAPGNVCLRFQRGAEAAVAKAFAGAAHRVTVELTNQRLICAALEPRAVIAQPSDSGGLDGHQITLYSATQVPHQIRKFVSEELGLAESAVRVVAPDVGGGFGTKGKHYAEELVLAWAARRLDRALKWVSTRSEAFLTDYQARDHVTRGELALDAQGRFLALRVDTLASLGAYVSTVGAAVPSTIYTGLLSGPYRIPAIFADVKLIFTNTIPTDAYRGAGRPEAAFVLESLVEEAARHTGLDRMELRRRNFVPADGMPYTTAIGPRYDSGDFPRVFDNALALADYAGFASRRAASREKGLLRGFGIAYFVESSGVGPSKFAAAFGSRMGLYDSAEIRVAADGSMTVSCGTHSHGQGHATTFAQVLGSRIGVPIEQIQVMEGDTARVPYGSGTFGSRSMVIAGSAIVKATDKVLAKARRLAAHLLEATEQDVEHFVVDGKGAFRIVGTDRSVSWPKVAHAALTAHDLPAGLEPALNESAFFDPENLTWSNGAHACEVEIDVETGKLTVATYVCVDDVGTVVNPLIVEGQIQGAVAQGLGQALFEEAVYDPQSGQLYTASFMDYCLPRADVVPPIVSRTDESQPCRHNPLGVKGCGESGTIGAPPAIKSAIEDALRARGISGLSMPFTAEKLWKALRDAPGED